MTKQSLYEKDGLPKGWSATLDASEINNNINVCLYANFVEAARGVIFYGGYKFSVNYLVDVSSDSETLVDEVFEILRSMVEVNFNAEVSESLAKREAEEKEKIKNVRIAMGLPV